MLPRTTEPELMDDDVQAKAYADADFAAPHDAFVDLFVHRFGDVAAGGGVALDIGCGPADVVVRLAQRCPRLIIDGVDGAEAMLRLGRARVHKAGLSNRVRLYRALLPMDPLPRVGVDVITSNSILHHLHDPSGLWTAVRRAARPGTAVFIMDLMRPKTAADVDRFVDVYAAGEPEILRRDFAASLHAAFTVAEVEQQLQQAGLPLCVEATSDRHLLVSGVLP
jgi:ubiquinone/menaquinone biosynthesis C-methylase UbiE